MRTTNDIVVICKHCGAHMKPKVKWIGNGKGMSFWICPYCGSRDTENEDTEPE